MKITDRFIYGTQYYRAPTPLQDEWEYDLNMMPQAGLDTIQIRVQWRWNERREGEYYFDDIDRLFDLAEKYNKQVIMKFMLETAPDYVFQKYDGARRDMHGNLIRPGGHGAFYVGGWWPCFDNPQVLSKAKKFVMIFTERYKERKSLLMWNIWNEPRMRPIGDCGCQYSLKNYRSWLEQEYKTIDTLNNHFGKCWGDFDTVDTPGMPYDYVELFLWRKWARRSLSNRLAEFYKVVKTIDPNRPVMTHVGLPAVQQDAAGDVSDDLLNCKEVDFYGTSFGLTNICTNIIEESTPSLICDWIRNVNEYFWVYELYPDWGRWQPPVSVFDYAYRMWSAIACGSKGILLWQYRAERVGNESNLAGLVNIDGSFKEISYESGRISKFIKDNQDFLMKSKVQDDGIAILYDIDSDLINRIENTGKSGDLNNFDLAVEFPYHYKKAVAGIHALFREAGFTCRVIDTRNLAAQLDGLEVIYVPQGFMLTDKVIGILERFAAAGGRVIAEEGLTLRDSATWVRPQWPSLAIQKMFGTRITSRAKVIFRPEKIKTDDAIIPASEYVSYLEAKDGAETIGAWDSGNPAIVKNGNCYFIATSLGAAFYDNYQQSQDFLNVLALLLEGRKPAVPCNLPKGVYKRVLKYGDRSILFLFNTAWTEQTVCLQSDKNTYRVLFGGATIEKGEITLQSRAVQVLLFEEK